VPEDDLLVVDEIRVTEIFGIDGRRLGDVA
jgi:hypothetical protein